MQASNEKLLPRPSGLKQYADAGWTFVKLHRYDVQRKLPPTPKFPQGRILDLGKAPKGKAWVKEGIKLSEAVKHANGGENTGALIPPDWGIIDVDPRNFKGEDNSFERLCKDIGLEQDKFPVVRTGSGGWHLFGKLPTGWKGVVKTEEYPGIELKQLGSQVVAAGSIHPKTKGHYEWQDGSVALADAPPIPAKMLEMYQIKRPLVSGSQGGDTWGSLTTEQVTIGLDALDPSNFQTYDDWFGLMCSVHWLSGGEARTLWMDWSTQDPNYADQYEKVGQHWDSLGRGSASAQLVARGGQFFKALKTIGIEPHDPRFGVGIEKAFAEISAEEIEEDMRLIGAKNELVRQDTVRSSEATVEMLNQRHFVLNYRGKTVIGTKRRIETKEGIAYDSYEFQDAASFKLFYANYKMPEGASIGEYWLQAQRRRTYDGFDFRPEEPPGAYRTMSGDLMLNQWTGFATQPRPGDWSMFADAMLNVLCKGDKVKYEYLLNWCAKSYQQKTGPIGTAVVIKGKKGTGKTTFWQVWSKPFGPSHSMITSKMESVFGAHNGRMHAKLAVGLEEAYFAGSKQAENQLKELITGDTFGINEKFLPEYAQTNNSRIVILTNDDWAVPATEDERRYYVLESADDRRGDHKYWEALRKQMGLDGEGGTGSEAFFYDMMHRDISTFNAYRDLPFTEELMGQIEITRGPMIDWLVERLTFGINAFAYTWTSAKGKLIVPKQEWWEDFKSWQINSPRGRYDSSIKSQNAFTRELKRVLPEYRLSTSIPPPEYQVHVRTYPAMINGREYHLANVYQFESLDFVKRTLMGKYGVKFQTVELEDEDNDDFSILGNADASWDIM